jgi:hypothetical protein
MWGMIEQQPDAKLYRIDHFPSFGKTFSVRLKRTPVRGFSRNQRNSHSPELGQILWPGDKWRCTVCLENSLPGGIAAEQIQYTAKLGTNDTASLCFRNPTELKYIVRAESSRPGYGVR